MHHHYDMRQLGSMKDRQPQVQKTQTSLQVCWQVPQFSSNNTTHNKPTARDAMQTNKPTPHTSHKRGHHPVPPHKGGRHMRMDQPQKHHALYPCTTQHHIVPTTT